jgi:hypothetical protein
MSRDGILCCPNCHSEMELIGCAVEGLALDRLRLCPNCYLVAWDDENGTQVRQGVPLRKGDVPPLTSEKDEVN